MSGVRRFLSRRDKSPHPHHHLQHHRSDRDIKQQQDPLPKPARSPDHFGGVFASKHDPSTKPDKEEEKKVNGILERLRHYGIDNIVESNVEYALHTQASKGDAEAAFRLLMLLEDTYEGIVKPYSSDVKLVGAVNRDGVTCFLDSLLFAMFVRLDSFEAMLYNSFEDAKRKRLAGLLRLWVNLLRTGVLITTDITEHIQRALADCGWIEAAKLQQQDPSEAFTFITGQLELPMLTLKMDMYHTGKEDPQDDHKFINERLLEVAIIGGPVDGKPVITLEDCLEHYFNNRIEVKRHMESQRRNTLKNIPAFDGPTKLEKESGAHIEVLEVPETPIGTPTASTPLSEAAFPGKLTPVEKLRPTLGRKRADSIFSQRKFELTGIDPEQVNTDELPTRSNSTLRKMSTRTEVLMPAWQFFKLLPWYTDNMPTSDAQVAAHFSKKRPVLGICLKRYSYTNTGQARRLDTYVDIPLEIAVPNFVSDEQMQEDGPLVGNFRLMLQSVVCHRGVSLNSGHYVCLSRVRAAQASPQNSENDSDDVEDPWMRFDDLAKERISYVNIHEALRKETPYLLFYQVQPIGDDGHSIHDLPTYAEATSRSQSDATTLEKSYLSDAAPASESALQQVMSEPAAVNRSSVDVADFVATSERGSVDTTNNIARDRLAVADDSENRRKSITIDTSSLAGSNHSTKTDTHSAGSVPTTPSEDKANNSNTFLSVANKISSSRRGSRQSQKETSRSRASSREGNGRFSLNMTKLTQKVSNKSDYNVLSSTGEKEVTVPMTSASEMVRAEYKGLSSPDRSVAAPAGTLQAKVNKEDAHVKPAPKLKKEKGGGKRKGEAKEERDCVVM